MELDGENVIPRNRAGKGHAVDAGRGGERRDRAAPGSSCARNRSGCGRRMPCHSGCGPRLEHLVPAHVRDLRAPAPTSRGTRPGSRPSPGVSPSSPRSNSICSADAHAEKGLVAPPASITASRAPLAASWRMQSGMAPWPGTTTRSAARIAPGSAVTRTRSSGATCSSALDTERRLPMP